MEQEYSDEELFRAAQAADAAGDTEAARKLTQALIAGKTQDEIETLAANLGQTIDKQALAANIASRDVGGPTNRFVQREPTGTEIAGTSLVNSAIGLGQGMLEGAIDLPLSVASGVQTGANAVLDTVIGGGLDVLGFDEAADAWRRTGQAEEERRAALANPVAQTFNALAPPPPGYETQRDVARFMGGFMLPGPDAPRAPIRAPVPAAPASEAAQIVAEGVKRNVPVMTTDVAPPQSRMGTFVKQTLPEKIPFLGTSGPRATQQEARQQAVADLVTEFGGNASRDVFDGSITPAAEVSKLLTIERSRRLTNLTTAKDSVIDSISAPFQSAPETVKAIKEQVRALQEIDPQEFAPVIERLQRFGDRLTSGASLRTVEEQRKLLGEMFQNPNLASIKGRGQKAINAIYDPLRRDMGAFIEAQAGSGARAKWSRANEELSAMAGELTSTRFKNVLSNADTTPDVVGRILFSREADPADIQRLVSNLDEAGRGKVRSAIIQQAFDTAGGAQGVSVERFMSNLNRLSKQVGTAFTGRDRESLMGFRRLMEATRRASVASTEVRTGEQALPLILGFGLGPTPVGIGGLLARVYESPPARDLLLRLNKTKPGSQQESKTLELIMRSTAPIVNQWRQTIDNAVNDNTAGALAAENQNAEENQ